MKANKQTTVGLIFLVMGAFMLINTSLFFPENAEQMQQVILVYTAMTAIFLAYNNKSMKIDRIKTGAGIAEFSIFAVGTYLLVSSIAGPSLGTGLLGAGFSVAFALFTAVVVAFSEEVVFRGILKPRVGNVMQALLFSLFHFAVSGGNAWHLLVFFVLGLAWGKLNDMTGGDITASIGSHTGWNLAAASIATIIGATI